MIFFFDIYGCIFNKKKQNFVPFEGCVLLFQQPVVPTALYFDKSVPMCRQCRILSKHRDNLDVPMSRQN